MAKHQTMVNGVQYDFEFISKVFEGAKEVIANELALELEGLQVIAENCKDDRTTARLNKRLDRIKSILGLEG